MTDKYTEIRLIHTESNDIVAYFNWKDQEVSASEFPTDGAYEGALNNTTPEFDDAVWEEIIDDTSERTNTSYKLAAQLADADNYHFELH